MRHDLVGARRAMLRDMYRAQKPLGQVKTALVVAAHPDDAEYGCGATIAKLIKSGTEVHYVIATTGSAGDSTGQFQPQQLGQIRKQEQLAAAGTLGVKAENINFLGIPDGDLEYTKSLRGSLVWYIRKLRPQVVFTHECTELVRFDASGVNHCDHRNLGRVTMDAVYPYARVAHQYALQRVEPHQVPTLLMWDTREPNFWMNVYDTAETKLKALSCHKSQGHPGMQDWFRSHMKEMGQDCELHMAEAFRRFTFA